MAAVISQVPFLDRDSQTHRSSPEITAQMLAVAAAGGYLPAVGQPHEAAFIHAPGAETGWRHVVATGEDSRWRNRVSASWLLGPAVQSDPPRRHVALPVAGLRRRERSGRQTRSAIGAARRAPQGELRAYPGVGHLDIYDGPQHEAVVADELEFLRRCLLGPEIHAVPARAAEGKTERAHGS